MTKSCGDIFIDLGFDEAEAQTQDASELTDDEKHVVAQAMDAGIAAKRMGIATRVSKQEAQVG